MKLPLGLYFLTQIMTFGYTVMHNFQYMSSLWSTIAQLCKILFNGMAQAINCSNLLVVCLVGGTLVEESRKIQEAEKGWPVILGYENLVLKYRKTKKGFGPTLLVVLSLCAYSILTEANTLRAVSLDKGWIIILYSSGSILALLLQLYIITRISGNCFETLFQHEDTLRYAGINADEAQSARIQIGKWDFYNSLNSLVYDMTIIMIKC